MTAPKRPNQHSITTFQVTRAQRFDGFIQSIAKWFAESKNVTTREKKRLANSKEDLIYLAGYSDALEKAEIFFCYCEENLEKKIKAFRFGGQKYD